MRLFGPVGQPPLRVVYELVGVCRELGEQPQERLAQAMYYGPTNRNAKLPQALMNRTSTAPETLAKMVPVDWNYVASVQDQWSAQWRRDVIPAQ